jgi:hypothetical protein
MLLSRHQGGGSSSRASVERPLARGAAGLGVVRSSSAGSLCAQALLATELKDNPFSCATGANVLPILSSDPATGNSLNLGVRAPLHRAL